MVQERSKQDQQADPNFARRRIPMTKLPIAKIACVVFAFYFVAAIAASAQTYTDLYDMGATSADPNDPVWSGVIAQGRDGNMYSTTPQFWTGGGGDVFKISPAGKVTVIYNFPGSAPQHSGGLTLATDGKFYGTTPNGSGKFGYGTIFSITPEGSLTTLYSFTNGADGADPTAPPIEGLDGNFYGTTAAGGESVTDGQYGSVYKITPSGVFTTLHTFANTDGANPVAPLLQAADGSFYGTTWYGGTSGAGTIFRITASGSFRVMFNFNPAVPGNPFGALVQDSAGNFYGTTSGGNADGNDYGGIVFKFVPGELTVLHNFAGGSAGGDTVGLVQATDGNFYGANCVPGFIFIINSKGGNFSSFYIGGSLQDTPFQHTNGLLYGTSAVGGAYDRGLFYSFDVGLKPFVTFLPAARPVGGVVQILGQGFTGATAVSFNGTAATFTAESDTYLTAIVPAGATTGSVTVATPGGTLTSNKIFRVVPQISSFSPTDGTAGTTVVITGNSLLGATEVFFACGKKATFTVDSDTQITATVPAGAMTGDISVVTPGGNTGSPTVFTVTAP
jgi:uncharacterized repeat protein (TIGR03803 family)